MKTYYAIYNLGYFLEKDINATSGEKRNIINYTSVNPKSVREAIKLVLDRIKNVIPNVDILVVDLTRSVFGVPVVRVIVTDDIQRLNSPLLSVSQRLYAYPVNMGYADDPSKYEELYLGNHPR